MGRGSTSGASETRTPHFALMLRPPLREGGATPGNARSRMLITRRGTSHFAPRTYARLSARPALGVTPRGVWAGHLMRGRQDQLY